MGIIFFLGVLAAITLAVFIVLPRIKFDLGDYHYEGNDKVADYFHVSRWYTLIPAFLFVLAWILSSLTQVQSKELGVVTSFGQPVSEVGPGLHLTWPWEDVTKVDETIFSDTYGANNDGIPVRLGDGSSATVNATIRWHVDPAAADYIYKNYRSNNPAESLKDSVVDTQFKSAVAQVLSGFNPTAGVSEQSVLKGVPMNFNPNYLTLAQQITALMQSRVKDADGTSLVVLDGITVAGVQYSAATETRINTIVAQAAATEQAVQAEGTALAQSKANSILQSSLSNNPLVLVSKCIDGLVEGKFAPPAGFSCWPGQGSSVVIPAK